MEQSMSVMNSNVTGQRPVGAKREKKVFPLSVKKLREDSSKPSTSGYQSDVNKTSSARLNSSEREDVKVISKKFYVIFFQITIIIFIISGMCFSLHFHSIKREK